VSARQIPPDRKIPIVCALILLLLAGGAAAPAAAQKSAAAQTPAQSPAQSPAMAVSIGFRPTAPYVLQRPDGSLDGLEYELVMAAGRQGGLALKAELAPFGRLPEDFRRGVFGAVVPASPAMGLPGCLSDTVLLYRNMVFTLARRGLTVAGIPDLGGLDIMAFQNAQVVLGPAMMAIRQTNPNYREVANQMLQVRGLFSGRTDAVIAERRIFHHFMRSSEAGVDTGAPVSEHDIFPPTAYGVAFQTPEHCTAFNRGLELLKRSGGYDAILNRWDGPVQARSGALPRRTPG
jgi:polar amino acid transport system substrate-binding protein